MLERSNKQPLRVVAEPEKRPAHCLHCESSQLNSKGRYRRQVRHRATLVPVCHSPSSFDASCAWLLVTRSSNRFQAFASGAILPKTLPSTSLSTAPGWHLWIDIGFLLSNLHGSRGTHLRPVHHSQGPRTSGTSMPSGPQYRGTPPPQEMPFCDDLL